MKLKIRLYLLPDKGTCKSRKCLRIHGIKSHRAKVVYKLFFFQNLWHSQFTVTGTDVCKISDQRWQENNTTITAVIVHKNNKLDCNSLCFIVNWLKRCAWNHWIKHNQHCAKNRSEKHLLCKIHTEIIWDKSCVKP